MNKYTVVCYSLVKYDLKIKLPKYTIHTFHEITEI